MEEAATITGITTTSSEIEVSFAGPFSWAGTPDAPSIYEVPKGQMKGVYLWTVPLDDGHLICYVGDTSRTFAVRMDEHYTQHAAANYHVFSMPEFARGEKRLLWPGRNDKSRKSALECIKNHPQLSESIIKMAGAMRFFLAPLSCSDRLRRRIEAAIALPLYDVPGIIGNFQEEFQRKTYNKAKRTVSGEPVACVVNSAVAFFGLPKRLAA